MPQEISFASFNVLNLGLPGARLYDNLDPYTAEQYEAKTAWIAQQMDRLDADIIGFQEIFSQAALKDVLAKTQKYRQARHAGFEPDPAAAHLTPSVALVSRLPLASEALAYPDFPDNLSVPQNETRRHDAHRFTRPVLHAKILLSAELHMHVLVVHLKSKRPDFLEGEVESNPVHLGAASLRSLIRRGTEALGLRFLLTGLIRTDRMPVVLMGDFNDVIGAASTQLVMNAPRGDRNGFDEQFFDSYRLQTAGLPERNIGYTTVHKGRHETIDHILVSEQFNPASRYAVGEVREVIYLNDHLALPVPEASDHGQVRARIRLFSANDAQTLRPDALTNPGISSDSSGFLSKLP